MSTAPTPTGYAAKIESLIAERDAATAHASALAQRVEELGREVQALRSNAIALNTMHRDCHKAADAFWTYWRENGETHKHGYYESTWGAINRALETIGVVPWKSHAAIDAARKGEQKHG